MTESEMQRAQANRYDDWWRSAVVYQIYPRSFADSNGDGIGDLPGIISHLDHMKDLGVDVIWLSPIYTSPMDDNGYDISNYQDIDPMFGTLDDFDRLVSGVHARGMKLIIDIVVNHTSDEHPWFIESRDPMSEKANWYWWHPARDGKEAGEPGAEPTNWGSFFSGPAWHYDQERGDYYLHLFSRKQPDLNWEEPAVRQAVFEMMRWWLDRGVDGFRLDVINLISKPGLVDGPETPGTGGLSYEPSLVADGPRMHEFLGEMRDEVFAGRNLLTVGETPLATVEDARGYTNPTTGELTMVFQFEHVMLDHGAGGKFDPKPLSWADYKANVVKWDTGIKDGWNSLYWENHDQPRSLSRIGDDSPQVRVASAKTLATLLHMQRGTPYIYQGQELGMSNYPFTAADEFQDIESVNYLATMADDDTSADDLVPKVAHNSRDNARTPMQWNSGPNGGFSVAKPWLPVNPDYVDVNAQAQWSDKHSVLHHYQALIALRHDHEVVRTGALTMLLPTDEQIFAFERTLGDQRLLVVANVTSQTVDLPASLPDMSGATVLLTTHPEVSDDSSLAAWESRVVRLA